MDTLTNQQNVLSDHIQMLTEWGMSKSELEQIVWEWDENRNGYYFHNSPEQITNKISRFLDSQNRPSPIEQIKALSWRF
ncbi:hypothetical protein [Shewanella sp. 30m-9]